MAKGDRNRQQAREKIAQMRALEARRRRRWRWLAGLGAVVVVAAVAVGIALAANGSSPHGANAAGSSPPPLKLASLATLGTLHPAPSPGPAGPRASRYPAPSRWPARPRPPPGSPWTASNARPASRSCFTSTRT